MFRAPLPDVPDLFVCASASASGGNWISATGIGRTSAEAQLRHDAERAERSLLAHTGAGGHTRPGDVFGIAAGTDGPEQVRQRAAGELLERWLCRGWWDSRVAHRRPARRVLDAFDSALETWPRRHWRRSGLRQLCTGDLPDICIAWSCDGNGTSLCFGTACHAHPETAARRAVQELYQMEFGLAVIRHRDAHGVDLSPRERRALDRATGLTFDAIADRLTDMGSDAALPDTARLPAIDFDIFDEPGGHHIVLARSPDIAALADAPGTLRPATGWSLYGDG